MKKLVLILSVFALILSIFALTFSLAQANPECVFLYDIEAYYPWNDTWTYASRWSCNEPGDYYVWESEVCDEPGYDFCYAHYQYWYVDNVTPAPTESPSVTPTPTESLPHPYPIEKGNPYPAPLNVEK